MVGSAFRARIQEAGPDEQASLRILRLAGTPKFTAEHALPALVDLAGDRGQELALRVSFGTAEQDLDGLAARHRIDCG